MTSAKRFWSKVSVRGPDDCWPWTAGTNNDGYGNFKDGGTCVKAHRKAWELTYGTTDRHVLHTCDNPPCCNPSHLFEGTHQDNMDDRQRKGRTSRRSRNQGEANAACQLTEDDVREIRRRRSTGEPLAPIAGDYRVSVSLVSMIYTGKVWGHVK